MGKYVRNAWYPAAWSRDVGRTLVARRILEEDIVLFRRESGGFAALEDLCPHRLAPLSLGRLKGDHVECGYHGLLFDGTGKCVRVPGQDHIPSTANARAYPVHENMGLVWIWMGDPALADVAQVPDVPQYHQKGKWWPVEGDALPIACHYLSLADNLCDPSHVAWVHASTLGNASAEDVPVHHEKRSDDHLVTWRWIIDAPAIPIFRKFGGYDQHTDRWHYYHYHAPSTAIIDFGTAKTGTGAPEGRRDDCAQVFACHFLTPVDERNCIDHWLFVNNFETDATTAEGMRVALRGAFDEDKVILEGIQKNEDRTGRRPVKLAIDAAPTAMRRMVAQRIAREEAAAGRLAQPA
jgi:vanillate O-demethylase monooxygenase subunit